MLFRSTDVGVLTTNPECYDDCFPPDHCVSLFLRDYKAAGGTCSFDPDNPFPMATNGDCELGEQNYNNLPFPEIFCYVFGMNRTKGICSEETETAIKQESCYFDVFSKSQFLTGTFGALVYESCSQEAINVWCLEREFGVNPKRRSFHQVNGRANRKKKKRTRSKKFKKKIRRHENSRINPITFVGKLNSTSEAGGLIKTELDFENTRHRYPDRKSTRLNSSHSQQSRMPSSA